MRSIRELGTPLLGIAIVLGPVMTSASPAVTANRMQIHEVYYNSPGPDTGSNASLNAEWVQLHNTSGSRISLTSWRLRDAAGHIYTFGNYTIGPYGYVKIHTGQGSNTQADRYWGSSWYIWNNTGDHATLKYPTGSVVDYCAFGGTSAGYVYC